MKVITTIITVGLCVTATQVMANDATVNVANNGLDSPTCGSRSAPCRSIGRGIERANPGDTVLVGPGKYGDINGDGQLGGVGEEINFGTSALRITKSVRVVSSAGAVLTVIDGAGLVYAPVDVHADGVTFGAPGAGFTLAGGQFEGLMCEGQTNVRISGNIVSGSPANGFMVTSTGYVDVSDNIAHDNVGVGFIVASYLESQRVVLRNNQSYANGSGILSASYGRHEISYNDVSNNANTGIQVDYAPAYIHHNTVSGNDIGMSSNSWSPDHLPTAGPVLFRNTLIGNKRFGIMVVKGPPVRTLVKENNFYGNGVGLPLFGNNCGLANFTGETLSAVNSYWGATTGPGAEPADVACGNDPVTTIPFARSPN